MSVVENEENDERTSSLLVVENRFETISIYLIWNSNVDEEWKIQASFGKNLDENFCRIDQFQIDQKTVANLYQLDYKLLLSEQSDNVTKTYQLKFLRQTSNNNYKIYDDVKQRTINTRQSHEFLCDTRTSFTNKNVSLASEFWNQLCFYSYFLIKNKMYEHFRLFSNRFFQEYKTDKALQLTSEIFGQLFRLFSIHLPQINLLLKTDTTAVQIYFHLLSKLPLNKTNFDYQHSSFRSLATELYDSIKIQLDKLLESLDLAEWISLSQGLVVFMSADMLDNSTSFNTMNLLEQMKTNPEKQSLTVNILFQYLIPLQSVIRNDSWTELISLIKNRDLLNECLELVHSMNDCLIVLQHIISDTQVNDAVKLQLAENFNQLVNRTDFIVNFETVLNLLNHLQPDNRTALCSTHEKLQIFQVIIKSSGSLHHKIKILFDQLDTNTISLENFYQLFKLDQLVSLLDIDKKAYLIKILTSQHNRTVDFYINWFIYFLCEKHSDVNPFDQLKFQQLLQSWLTSFQNDQYIFLQILSKLDKLLDHLQDTIDNSKTDKRFMQFIEQFINICFSLQNNNWTLICQILREISMNIIHQEFLVCYQKRFIEIFIIDHENQLKSMNDKNNPFNHLLIVNQEAVERKNSLLNDLIAACTQQIHLSKEEIFRETFHNPTKNSLAYTILFEKQLHESHLYKTILKELQKIWRKWIPIGVTISEIHIWKKFTTDQLTIFQKIWDKIRVSLKEEQTIENHFQNALNDHAKKLSMYQSLKSTLETYCFKATDFERLSSSLRDMFNDLYDKPIQQVHIPTELQKIELIAVQLEPFLNSQVWNNYYLNQNNHSDIKTIDMHALKAIDSKSFNMDSDDDDDDSLPSQRSSSISLPENNRGRNSNENSICILILRDVHKIFEQFREHMRHLAGNWEKEPISEWIQLFTETDKIKNEFDLLVVQFHLELSEKIHYIFEFWKHKDQIDHICHGCLNLIERFHLSSQENTPELFRSLIKINEHTFGDECSNAYEQYFEEYLSRYSTNTFVVLTQFSKAIELIEFLETISSTDLENILENVNYGNEKLVGTKTVRDFQILKDFFEQVYKLIEALKSDTFNLSKLLDCFEQSRFNNQIEDLQQFFTTCSIELPIMKQSYYELTDKEQTKRRLIGNIMCLSIVQIIQTNNTFDIRLSPQNIDFSDLCELRDRARLIEYSWTNEKSSCAQFQNFIQFVEKIEKILHLLIYLDRAGYPLIESSLNKKSEFPCENEQFNDLTDFHVHLEQICQTWDRTLCEKYIKYPELTYFSWKQFDIIEDYLLNRHNTNENHQGYHLLRYIGIQPTILHEYQRENRSPEDRLEYLGSLLSEQRIQTRCNLFGQSLNRKIFLLETNENQLLKSILSLYKRFDQTPTVNHHFYCTNETNWIQIRAFIYRSFFSQEFHQLIQPEILSIDIHDRMIDLIRNLIIENPKQLFCMAFVLTKPAVQLQLIDGLKLLQLIQSISEQELINEFEYKKLTSNLIQRCWIYTSTITGLGKSYMIREECRIHKLKHIKFPINGNVEPDSIAKRLLAVAEQFSTSAIHLDLGVIDNYQQINDLMNCLILFRSFSLGQNAIFIPEQTPIYIELDSSSHSNLFDTIGIFQSIPCQSIEHIDWKQFHVTEQVQFVCNYLKAMADQSIIRKDIYRENVKQLSVSECAALLQHNFFPANTSASRNVSWIKVFLYVSILDKLFDGFSKCGFFSTVFLPDKELKQSRMDLLKAFLESIREFTSVSVENVREQQRLTRTRTNTPLLQKFSDAIISWNQIRPFMLIFTPTFDPIFVYKTEQNIPQSVKTYINDYDKKAHSKRSFWNRSSSKVTKSIFPDYRKLEHEQLFHKLIELSSKYTLKAVCPRCFRTYNFDVETCMICSDEPVKLERPDSLSDESSDKFKTRIASLIKTTYVITPDNFIKMLLVYLRVESNVPVLIMGETGCGKTALIICLCRKILNDELYIFRLHAGITNEILLNKMDELIIQANNLPKNKRLWVFFDEFNTIFNISLLKEMICERTLLGRNLPDNMVFLGTCNPTREKSLKTIFSSNVGLKKDRYKQLQHEQNHPTLSYTVTPIPETMLEYVWDYGNLDDETEKTYIRATLSTYECFSKNPDVLEVTIELVSESHKFLKQLEDVNSVSLRDIVRFARLFQWFNAYLQSTQVDVKRIPKDSSRLALLLCYYFRLETREHKEKYLNKLDEYLCEKYPHRERMTFAKAFKQLLLREQTKLLNQLEKPVDMAFNQALRDNLFVLFPCIMNRIPVFLCGKPGASKTSAVQILMNNFKGSRSNKLLFRQYPELVAVTFQGTQTCTSKNIEQIFERANKFMQMETDSSILPVIIFDEIGLAESSVHNPLKVLHGHLEIEECQFGFVGLSNWRLDAAKMNRALYIACLDPDDTDLEETGKFLVEINLKSHVKNRFDSNMIRNLSQAYVDLQKRMSKEYQLENYFGLRDYYSLIKGIVADDQTYPARMIFEIIYQQLVMNFGGINPGYEYMWEKFCTLMNRHKELIRAYPLPNPKELIHRCLTNRNNRHLMLISDRESTIDHIERYLITNSLSNYPVKTLVGSRFEGDFISKRTYTEAYSARILMEIILLAETPITLVVRHMDHLYDNLYDLFNQNFAITARKKYCRIALSSIYNPRCLIHDQFYSIILVKKADVNTSDPPFLNRFQKYLVERKKLIEHKQQILTERLINWLTELPLTNVNPEFLLVKHLIPPFHEDFICGLIIDISENDGSLDENTILEICKKKLLRTSSFDFPLLLSFNGENEFINDYYEIHQEFVNFNRLVSSTFSQAHSTKRIIYTYTPSYDRIEYETTEQIHTIKLSSIKTELALINLLKSWNAKQQSNSILVIRIDYHREFEHLLSLKYNILNHWIDHPSSHLWLIFHIQRNRLSQMKNEVLFPNWDIIMIENLNQSNDLISKDILLNPSYRYFIEKSNNFLLETFFNEFLHRTISKCRYEQISKDIQTERYNRLFQILNHETDQYFRRILLETIDYFIKTISNPDDQRFQDWRKDLLADSQISLTSRSFDEALQASFSLYYNTYFQLLIHHFETYNLIDSYFFMKSNSLKRNFWEKAYRSTLKTIDNSIMNSDRLEINYQIDLRLPYALKERSIFKQIKDIEIEQAIDLLKQKSIYGTELIEEILSNESLLNDYYHDQLRLFHLDNQFQFSIELTLKILTTNLKRKLIDRLIELLSDPNELIDILHIIEDGLKIIDENTLTSLLNEQITSIELLEVSPKSIYSIVYEDDEYRLVDPNSRAITESHLFELDTDPFIEVTLMNLIKEIISNRLISNCTDIEHVIARFSSIYQRCLNLQVYQVNNIDKLCSLMSLLRCIQTLFPSKTIEIYRKISNDYQIRTCDDIHRFMTKLERNLLHESGSEYNQSDIRWILLKLEIQFLKDCWKQNKNELWNLLKLIDQKEKPLWKYSSTIFYSLISDFNLSENIESNDDFPLDQSDEINQLNQQLKSQINLQRLLTDRLYLNFILKTSTEENRLKGYLSKHHDLFAKRIEFVNKFQTNKMSSYIQLIRCLAWLKYYAQLYSNSLSQHWNFPNSEKLDEYLTRNETLFCSTMKLYILKQTLFLTKMNLKDLETHLAYRKLNWLNEFYEKYDQENLSNTPKFLMPIPLFYAEDEYKRVNRILTDFTGKESIEELISSCSNDPSLIYCFYVWFIKYYAQYSSRTMSTNENYKDFFEGMLSKQSKIILQPIGIRFLQNLCSNFTRTSYFHLDSSKTTRDVTLRLVVLNVFALALAFKSLPHANWLNTILFENNSQMPENYFEHLQKLCLFGLQNYDPIKFNMLCIRKTVQMRLKAGRLPSAGKYIYQCSKDCLFFVHFSHCGIPNQKSQCPLCKRDIGTSKYGEIIQRDPPQIKWPLEEGMKFMKDYIERANQETNFGYYEVVSSDQSNLEERPEYLRSSISFRFLHFILHSILFLLQEFQYLTSDEFERWKIPHHEFFQNHIEKDYSLLEKCLQTPRDCYIYMFQLLNSMSTNDFEQPLGHLDSKNKVIELEKLIDQNLFDFDQSPIMQKITQYKQNYAEYTQNEQNSNALTNFLDERTEISGRYPYLNFFNITQNFQQQNHLNQLFHDLQTFPSSRLAYPLTMFILERIEIFSNIQYLSSIIQFINYLREKYNYRISRQDAIVKSIRECLDDKGSSLYKKFKEAWAHIELTEVRYGCQIRNLMNYKCNEKNLAFFSLNLSKDDSSLVLLATLDTLAKFQNDIVNYFHNEILQSATIRSMPVHLITDKHLFRFDRDTFNKQIQEHALVINFEYGQSQELIYDYEEIELTLRSMINRLPLINTDEYRKIHYQFELYSENNTLINHVRQHVQQKSIPDERRRQYICDLNQTDTNDILQYLGSLDLIFTYLQNRNYRSSISTIDLFVREYIQLQQFLNRNLFLQSKFNQLELEYIIDFYELIEELAFDKIFRNRIKQKLNDETISHHEQQTVQEKFLSLTINNEKIASKLRDVQQWIGTLKRFMVRILPDSVDLNSPIEIYLKRTDLWNCQITEDDIETISIDESILLKHTMIILVGLESNGQQVNETLINSDVASSTDEAFSLDTLQNKRSKPRRKK